MKHFPLLLIGIFAVLASSFLVFVLTTQNQLGSLKQSTEGLEQNDDGELVMIEGDPLFPAKKPGLADQGSLEYIKMGCVYCHSQQVRRAPLSVDIERGLGLRVSVPRDYILQDRVLIGNQRVGPDLSNVGLRQTDQNWHLLHLYNPQITSPGSLMPPFPFLFELEPISEATADLALVFPEGSEYSPDAGWVVVPSRRALALVEYLLALKFDYNLPEAIILENE